MHSIVATLLSLIEAGLPKIPVPSPSGAGEVLAKVQAYYQSISTLEASFRQTSQNVTFGRTATSDGKLYLMKPGKMRWDYQKPEKKYFISDGTVLWFYEEANKQAFRKDLKEEMLPVAVTFLSGQGDLGAEFDAALDPKSGYGTRSDHVLKLTPKQPTAQYKTLWLVVDPDDFHVKESVILEATDNVNQFRYTNIRLNAEAKRVKASLFKFKAPKGVKLIEPEGQGAGPP